MEFMETIISNLMKIGLTKYESMAYLTLLANQKITAYEISKRSGVPQSKIYGAVRSLIEKGIALPNETDPTKYAALPFCKFLPRLTIKIAAVCGPFILVTESFITANTPNMPCVI